MTHPNANKNVPAGEQRRDLSTFLNNGQAESAKTKSNLIQMPSVSLPKGGGAVKSIDEKFSVNPSTGTASFSVPLPFSAGRNGSTPPVALNYNSGTGNSIFGIGWEVSVPYIQRKLDKKLPRYKDTEESDTFLFSGAEDLVPELIKDQNGQWTRNKFENNNRTVTRYRPRIEGSFSRIEKIKEGENIYWQVRSRENE